MQQGEVAVSAVDPHSPAVPAQLPARGRKRNATDASLEDAQAVDKRRTLRQRVTEPLRAMASRCRKAKVVQNSLSDGSFFQLLCCHSVAMF